MYQFDLDSAEHLTAVLALRREVVTHLYGHLDSYWLSLLETTGSLELPEEDQFERVSQFLSLLRDDREWGGQETLLAVTRLYHCNILVYNEDGTRHAIPAPGASSRTLHVAYRLAGSTERTHYDSVIQYAPPSAPATSTTSTAAPHYPSPDSTTHYPPPETALAAWQHQHLVQASQISAGPPLTISTPVPLGQSSKVLIGSWNVRGCSSVDDQELVDLYFSSQQFLVVALQETRIVGCTIDTPHYIWLNVNDDNNLQPRIGGGTALLIHKSIFRSENFLRVSSNTCSYLCHLFGVPLLIVSTYIRSSSGMPSAEFTVLHRYLTHLPANLQQHLMILGDFNAHLGYTDLAPDDAAYIGQNLYHPESNHNGNALKNLLHSFRLRDYVSLSSSNSVQVTWANRRSCSQIDHVLMNKIDAFSFPQVTATFHPSAVSDHKILKCVLKRSGAPSEDPPLQASASSGRTSTCHSKRLALNLELLRSDTESQQRYHTHLHQLLRSSGSSEPETGTARWARVSNALRSAALHSIPRSKSPNTPRRSSAGRTYFHARQALLADRHNPDLKKQVEAARGAKQRAYQLHFQDKVDAYLTLTERHPPLEQMKQVYRFIKLHTRNRVQRKQQYISMQQWEEKLRTISQGNSAIPVLSEDASPALMPPTRDEIGEILRGLRNSTAPGQDGIPPELLRYYNDALLDEIYLIINDVYHNNTIPHSWLSTVQIPIAKVPRPRDVNDYRCITLCTVMYKVYASFLLRRLQSHLPVMLSYQMGFQASRSATDQIFVLRRILDERWQRGRMTILVSLDIRQAFDTVDIGKLAIVLQDIGVPANLINRILSACLVERTSVQWYGRRTPSTSRRRGVKQGCPLSPTLFILLLHHALMTLKEFMPEVSLHHQGQINLPCILGYADDLLFLCSDFDDVSRLLQLLEPLLASIGLELNTSKTRVLIRDPYHINNVAPATEQTFGDYRLTVVTKLRYLGAYFTSSLTRAETTAERIKKAYKSFHALCNFLRRYRLCWDVIRRLYHTLITPVATYSLEVSTLTKSNRNSLRHMESTMLETLQSLSSEFLTALHEPSADQPPTSSSNTNLVAADVSSSPIPFSDPHVDPPAPTNNLLPDQAVHASDHANDLQSDQAVPDSGYIAPRLLGGHTVNNRIRSARIGVYGHILRSEPNGVLKTALEYRLNHPRKRGRPCFTWRTDIVADIERSGHPIDVWQDWSVDRDKMKLETKRLLTTMVESEYETDSETDYDESDLDLLPSDFEGFADDSSDFEGF